MFKAGDRVYIIPKRDLPANKTHPEIGYTDTMEEFGGTIQKVVQVVNEPTIDVVSLEIPDDSYWWHIDWLISADGYSKGGLSNA